MANAPSPDFKSVAPEDQPGPMYILETNLANGDPPQNWIMLPLAGSIYVICEYQGDTAPTVWVWHQGGDTESVPADGDLHEFTVARWDALVYQLATDDQVIKLGYAYAVDD
jgi:hypothetical protein